MVLIYINLKEKMEKEYIKIAVEIGKIKGEKTKSRISTAEYKLGKPVPYSMGHGFLGLFCFCIWKHFNFFTFFLIKHSPRQNLIYALLMLPQMNCSQDKT